MLETEGGRSPFWGIAAGVVLVVFIVLALWRATANDGSTDSGASYSSQVVATSLSVSGGTAPSATSAPSTNHKSTTATTVFFFGLFGAMALVAIGIAWRTQRINRAAG